MILAMYRWYVADSQAKRPWNPFADFEWEKLRTDHSDLFMRIIAGFFAVEQYVPDYVEKLLRVIRRSHGRSYFHLRWGSEEEKHSDLWEATLLFSKRYSPQWIRDYKNDLISREWNLPFDDPIKMIIYTVFQELATRLNYSQLHRVMRGRIRNDYFDYEFDPVLMKATKNIIQDEAAHYTFFLEVARLFLYYFPAETLEAIKDVMDNFAMPAGDIIPNYKEYQEDVYKAGIYGRKDFRDLLRTALSNLSLENRTALIKGIKQSRLVPDENGGGLRETAIFTEQVDKEGNFYEPAEFKGFDFEQLESSIKENFERIIVFEENTGISKIDPVLFIPNRKPTFN